MGQRKLKYARLNKRFPMIYTCRKRDTLHPPQGLSAIARGHSVASCDGARTCLPPRVPLFRGIKTKGNTKRRVCCMPRLRSCAAVVLVCLVNFWVLSTFWYPPPEHVSLPFPTAPRLFRLPTRESPAEYSQCFTNLSQLVEKVAFGGSIVFTVVNEAYLPLGINMVSSLQSTGVYNYFLVAADKSCADVLAEKRLPCYVDLERKSIRSTSDIALELLRHGLLVVQSNPDVVWKSDALLDIQLRNYLTNSVAFSGDDSGKLSAAVYAVKSTPQGIDIFERARKKQMVMGNVDDATTFTQILVSQGQPPSQFMLPKEFSSLRSLFRQDQANAVAPLARDPVTILSNLDDNVANKIWDLREAGGWLLDDSGDRSYMAGPFLHFSVQSWTEVKSSLKSALVLARLLGRTLILPEVPCPSSLGGRCPLRDVLWPVQAFNAQQFDNRVHSILRHPKFKAAKYERGVVGVRILTIDDTNSNNNNAADAGPPPSPDGLPIKEWISIRPEDATCGATNDELLRKLVGLRDVPVLHFASLHNKVQLSKTSKTKLDDVTDGLVTRIERGIPFALPSLRGCDWWRENRVMKREAIEMALLSEGTSLRENLPFEYLLEAERGTKLLVFEGLGWKPWVFEHLNAGGTTAFLEGSYEGTSVFKNVHKVYYKSAVIYATFSEKSIRSGAVKVPADVGLSRWDAVFVNSPSSCEKREPYADAVMQRLFAVLLLLLEQPHSTNPEEDAVRTMEVFLYTCPGKDTLLPSWISRLGDPIATRARYSQFSWTAAQLKAALSEVTPAVTTTTITPPKEEEEEGEREGGGVRPNRAFDDEPWKPQGGERVEVAQLVVSDEVDEDFNTRKKQDKKKEGWNEQVKKEKVPERPVRKDVDVPSPAEDEGSEEPPALREVEGIKERLERSLKENPHDSSAWENLLVYIYDVAYDKAVLEKRDEASQRCAEYLSLNQCNTMKLKIAQKKAKKRAFWAAKELFEEIVQSEPSNTIAWSSYLTAAVDFGARDEEIQQLFDRIFALEGVFSDEETVKLRNLHAGLHLEADREKVRRKTVKQEKVEVLEDEVDERIVEKVETEEEEGEVMEEETEEEKVVEDEVVKEEETTKEGEAEGEDRRWGVKEKKEQERKRRYKDKAQEHVLSFAQLGDETLLDSSMLRKTIAPPQDAPKKKKKKETHFT